MHPRGKNRHNRQKLLKLQRRTKNTFRQRNYLLVQTKYFENSVLTIGDMESRRVVAIDCVRAESSNSSTTMKRGQSEYSKHDSVGDSVENGDERGRKRKRKSRWMGDCNDKAIIPGMPTILPSGLREDQQESYIAQLQIEELTRKLRTGDFGISPYPGGNRSPSPEPFYGADGKRLNTREYRTRKKLEEERHRLVSLLSKLNPEYRPPSDYKVPIVKIIGRVEIPQEEHPNINFVGLIIGPRGNTLQALEKDTGAKIIIRGKGSVKEGKVGKGVGGYPLPGENEPLHAYITSTNQEAVHKACEKIREIIRQGIEMPESENALRKNQLMELARINGTLREGDMVKCSNCGATSHRSWCCPDKANVTSSIICTGCGGAGHIEKDCKMKRPGAGGPPVVANYNYSEKAKMDEEYMSLMAELGQETPINNNSSSIFQRSSSSGQHRSLSIAPQLFNKPKVPKAIEAPPPPPPPSASSSATTITSQRLTTQQSSVDMSHNGRVSQSSPSLNSWRYPSTSAYTSGYGSSPMMMWPPPLPVPPPPMSYEEPPPPGMYWQPQESKPPLPPLPQYPS